LLAGGLVLVKVVFVVIMDVDGVWLVVVGGIDLEYLASLLRHFFVVTLCVLCSLRPVCVRVEEC